MHRVLISDVVREKLEKLEYYLVDELKLSEEAALKRSQRMREFVGSLTIPTAYPLCRFSRWQLLGYRCAVFEKAWVFAYEIFTEGIIIRDMSHTAVLID